LKSPTAPARLATESRTSSGPGGTDDGPDGEHRHAGEEIEAVGERLESIRCRVDETSEGVSDDAAGLTEELTAAVKAVPSGVDERAAVTDDVARRIQRLAATSEATGGRHPVRDGRQWHRRAGGDRLIVIILTVYRWVAGTGRRATGAGLR
jgi:hypothetical protein